MSSIGLWALCTIVPLAFGLWAQMRVKRTFARYSKVAPRNGMSGAQAAAAVLRSSGLPEPARSSRVAGRLTDHYDPRNRTLNLSQDVANATSLAALGVAAHEAGHAIQDARGYAPMKIRQTLVPVATFGQSIWILPVFAGLILGLTGLTTIGLVLFSAVVLFQLVTLPVEFDASKRALVALEQQGLLASDEIGGARAVLNAAALTYVAGFVASLGQLLYFFLISQATSSGRSARSPRPRRSAPAARARGHRLVQDQRAERGRDHDARLAHRGDRARLGQPQRGEHEQVGAEEQHRRATAVRQRSAAAQRPPRRACAHRERQVDRRGQRHHDPEVRQRRGVVEAVRVDDRVARDARAAGERERDDDRVVGPPQPAHEQHARPRRARSPATCQADVAAPRHARADGEHEHRRRAARERVDDAQVAARAARPRAS